MTFIVHNLVATVQNLCDIQCHAGGDLDLQQFPSPRIIAEIHTYFHAISRIVSLSRCSSTDLWICGSNSRSVDLTPLIHL